MSKKSTRIWTTFTLGLCLNLSSFGQQASPNVSSENEGQISFEKIVLSKKYITEGASIGDIDADGHPDIIAGPMWWKGPDFTESHVYAPVKEFPIKAEGLAGYSDNFFTFPEDFNNDGWLDILQIGLPGEPSRWVKNPGKKSNPFKHASDNITYQNALDYVGNESPNFMNVIGDSRKELLAMGKGNILLGIPENEGENWKTLPITPQNERFSIYTHGLGAADINNDGLNDILEKNGWWEQPKNWDKKSFWTFHEYIFTQHGGAQMFAFDVDGDGDNDVVTPLNAHSYGLSWFEQITISNGIDFKAHVIMSTEPSEGDSKINFSQLHAMDCVDIDNDGILDIVTGKCFYAHNGHDPGAEEPAVLYWFKTKRNANGTVTFIPHKIDDNSGVGRQINTGDLNGDGKVDIVTANKKGVFAFIQK